MLLLCRSMQKSSSRYPFSNLILTVSTIFWTILPGRICATSWRWWRLVTDISFPSIFLDTLFRYTIHIHTLIPTTVYLGSTSFPSEKPPGLYDNTNNIFTGCQWRTIWTRKLVLLWLDPRLVILKYEESNELSVSRFEMMLQTKSFQGGKVNRCCKLFHLSQRADLERFQGFLVENSNVYKLLDYGLAIQW